MNIKRYLLAGTAAVALALTITGCGESEPEAQPEPTEAEATPEDESGEEGDSNEADPDVTSGWTDEDEALYQEQYEQTNQHLLDNYGIIESADLCDDLYSATGEDLDGLVVDVATEAGLEWGEEAHPADHGTFNALFDWCDSAG